MRIGDFMTPDPVVVNHREPIDRITELIRRHGIRHIPVVDDHNRLVGIVTERDLGRVIEDRDEDDAQQIVEDIMTHDVVTVIPGADLSEAADLLQRLDFNALPVVVGDRVVGIISVRHLLRRMCELLTGEVVPTAAQCMAVMESDPVKHEIHEPRVWAVDPDA